MQGYVKTLDDIALLEILVDLQECIPSKNHLLYLYYVGKENIRDAE